MMSQSSTSAYLYQPLRYQDSIRLLELLPGTKGSPLRCNLSEVRRCDKPEYEALSYAWGEPVFSHNIQEAVSETYLSITVNLYTALQGIRYEETSRILWIDAVCINQLEPREKGYQVAAMGNIYKDTWRVIVWLGAHEGPTKTIISLLADLSARIQILRDRLVGSENILSKTTDPDIDHIHNTLTRLGNTQFFQQSWQRRIWVVQEFILAREVQFLAADDIIPFDVLHSAIYRVSRLPKEVQYELGYRAGPPGGPSPEPQMWRMRQLCAYRKTYQLQQRKEQPHQSNQTTETRDTSSSKSLVECILDLTRERDCTEDRDRIYGLLAISKDSLGIIPDYELPLHEVYNDLAVRSLISGDTILLHVSGLRPGHQSELRSFFPHLIDRDVMTEQFGRVNLGFAASTTSFMVKPCTTSHLPCIRGMKIDVVCRTGDILRPKLTCHALKICQQKLNATEIITSNLADWLSKSATPPRYPGQVSTVWSFVPEKNELQWTLIIKQWAEARECVRWSIDYKYHGSDIGMATYLKNRHVFQTQQGYIGFGPFWMKPGDQVVIFDGGVTPFILRKNTSEADEMRDTWLHVGDCYLHGWMHGDYFGHTVVDELPSKEESTAKVPVDEEKTYLVREWFTLA